MGLGSMTPTAYALAPKRILHGWVEIRFDDRWANLEGFILDKAYLAQARQAKLPVAIRASVAR